MKLAPKSPPSPELASEIARQINAGREVVRIRHSIKKPLDDGWGEQIYTIDDFGAPFTNLGLKLGGQGRLCDIDLDCPEAEVLAPHFLPPTEMKHSRAGNAYATHWWYKIAPGELPRYDDCKKIGLELRCAPADGSKARQTNIPPSCTPIDEHSPPTALVWMAQGEPAEIGAMDIETAVHDLAAAICLLRTYPEAGTGKRHHYCLSLAGVLLRLGWTVDRTKEYIERLATLAGDPEIDDRIRAVDSTAAKVQAGESIIHKQALLEASRDPRLADLALRWLRFEEAERAAIEQEKEKQTQAIFAHLNERFRLFRDKSGTRIFQIDAKQEVTLLMDTALLDAVIHKFIKETEQIDPHTRRVHETREQWRLTAPSMPAEPAILSFRRDNRISFRVLDDPSPGPHPAWDEFLTRLSDPDAFCAFIGSLFDPGPRGRQYVWLWGNGQSGKSVVLDALARHLGEACTPTGSTTASFQSDFKSSEFYGKRLAIMDDAGNTTFPLSEAFRKFTGTGRLNVNFKYGPKFSADATAKLLVSSNNTPEIRGSNADMSRLILLEVTPNEYRTVDWHVRLITEMPQFLHTCLEKYETGRNAEGDIVINDKTRELIDTSAEDHEEKFHIFATEYLVFGKDFKVLRSEVRQRWGMFGGVELDIKALYDFLRRRLSQEHGKSWRSESRSCRARTFYGMKLK